MKCVFIAAATVMCVVLAGGAQSSAGEPSDPPREALIQAFSSLLKESKSGMLAHFEATPKEREGLAALYAFIQAGVAFRDAFIRAYGQQAWANFQDPQKGAGDGDANLELFGEKQIKELRRARIELQGNEAFCQLASVPESLRLVKRKGRWLVDATSLFPGNTDPQQMAKMLISVAAAVKKYQKAIGHPGIKPEDIDAELGRAMAKIMLGITVNAPHRFDIDKLSKKK